MTRIPHELRNHSAFVLGPIDVTFNETGMEVEPFLKVASALTMDYILHIAIIAFTSRRLDRLYYPDSCKHNLLMIKTDDAPMKVATSKPSDLHQSPKCREAPSMELLYMQLALSRIINSSGLEKSQAWMMRPNQRRVNGASKT